MNTCWHKFVTLFVLALGNQGCVPEKPADLPAVTDPASTDAVSFDWPWCDVAVPPLMGCGEWSSVEDIGTYIEPRHVCLLTSELKRNLDLDEWAEVRELVVCRSLVPPTGSNGEIDIEDKVGRTWIKAELTERALVVTAVLREETGEISYHRGPR